MKSITYSKRIRPAFWILLVSLFSCASLDPRRVDVEIKATPPEPNITNFTEALSNLGLMTEIYNSDKLLIQSKNILDETGTSVSTGGEIPKDITEMMKTSLNSIGGNVIFIPYDPSYIVNQIQTDYSNFRNKLVPNVVLSGGITEFDRGLSTKESATDISVGTEIKGLPGAVPSKDVELRSNNSVIDGLARISIDFNLLDYRTMSGLPRMNSSNSMEVHKAVGKKELAVSILGPTFGLKGNIKKIQGRHAAVRLLVELSTIQVVGKYLVLPYWRLLGDDAVPDRYVLDTIAKYYYNLDEATMTSNIKVWLYLYGFNIPLSGGLDQATREAIAKVDSGYNPADNKIGSGTFSKIYINIPITPEALVRRQEIIARERAAALEEQRRIEEEKLRLQKAETPVIPPEPVTEEKNRKENKKAPIKAARESGNFTAADRIGIGKTVDKDPLLDVLIKLSE